MTQSAEAYGCQNCNLIFYCGTSSGPSTHPSMYHYKVCRQCGWMYKLEATFYRIIHPLGGLFYRVPNYLVTNPKRQEIDAIKSAISEDTLMIDVANIMKLLPIRKQWLSMFEYLYAKAKTTLNENVSIMTVRTLDEACHDYDHTIMQQFAAAGFFELAENGNFWKHRDHYFDLSPEERKALFNPRPEFNIKINEFRYKYIEQDYFRTQISAFHNFHEVTCHNCHAHNSIVSSTLICPRCKENKIQKLLN